MDNVTIVFLVNNRAISAISLDVPQDAGYRVAEAMAETLVDVFQNSGACMVDTPEVAPI